MNKSNFSFVICFILVIALVTNSCCMPDKYSETCIESGELITAQLLEYVNKDTTLTDKEKTILKESCEQYLLLLKQQ